MESNKSIYRERCGSWVWWMCKHRTSTWHPIRLLENSNQSNQYQHTAFGGLFIRIWSESGRSDPSDWLAKIINGIVLWVSSHTSIQWMIKMSWRGAKFLKLSTAVGRDASSGLEDVRWRYVVGCGFYWNVIITRDWTQITPWHEIINWSAKVLYLRQAMFLRQGRWKRKIESG